MERYSEALEKEKIFKAELDNFYREQRLIESEMEDMEPDIHQIGQEKQYYERYCFYCNYLQFFSLNKMNVIMIAVTMTF